MRLDAAVKRDNILAAARHGFAAWGDDVPMTRIARRAGVSVATVYRRFPTRQALIAAAHSDQWHDCAAVQTAALRDPDPARALRALIRTHCRHQVSDRSFTRAYVEATVTGHGLAREREEAERVVAVLLARAQEAGTYRSDLGIADFRLLIAAHDGVLAAAGPDAAAASRRYLTLMLRSFETS